jgi:hypothetical protein
MKSNRIMWLVVMLVVFVTMSITFGTRDSRSQEKTVNPVQATPDNGGYEDLSKYAVVNYYESEPETFDARQNRKRANERYDDLRWVIKNPHPNTDGVGLDDELAPPEIIPVAKSDLIMIGEIKAANAHMSNDRRGVYSEFTIQVQDILKNDAVKKVEDGKSVIADREGGAVLYPNGQKVIYQVSNRKLPSTGNEYIFFLTSDKQSPNYKILTLYQLNGDEILRLDYGRNFDEFKNAGKTIFIESIRNKISH